MAQFFALLAWYWTDGLPFSDTSGIWTAYAWDFVNGEFYRPYFEETGYGGSRFMPLFFILLAGMMELVGIPSTAGAILTLLIGFCFLLALVRLMQKSEVPLSTAVPFVLLACFSSSFQLAHLEVRSDLLASFLNLIALGFAIQGIKKPTAATWIWMVVGFVLAWFSKITMGYGWVAVSLYLLFKRRIKAGCGLFLVTASLALLLWEILQTASGGRFDGSLATYFLKETSWNSILQVPFWFFKTALSDPFFLMLLGAAFWTLIVLKPLRGTFAEIYFWITFLGTVALFAIPDTDSIHLIDLLAASLWVLACGWSSQFKNRYPTIAILPMLMVGTLLTLLPGVDSVSNHFKQNGRPTFQDIGGIIKKLPATAGPVLSENPLIPILMGHKPYLLDAYSLRVLSIKFPEISQNLFNKLEKKQFRAVILTNWSPISKEFPFESMAQKKSLSGKAFYENINFPERFLSSLKKNYTLDEIVYPYYIFIPRSFPDNTIVFPAMDLIGR
ncbi:MAG: glycosyltransferase family 39 protein [Candidatus Nitronauta litoralis]|uniref:Glycosyltransferase family 39 protein n=1 Tax=Candidatus Nitronauta litoralis TaxID=2705533 RepID=A0A7T0G1M6_9BACT|nr:MAG: glycosyltransferase family 39 protein [Candidatus Nitronauta litoralis]